MPIYAYRCSSCGLQKDVMQKMSDAPLDTCPDCGKATFSKQLTAAGFQLKGSGYYVTDFRDGPRKPAEKTAPDQAEAKSGAAATTSGATSSPATSSTV